MCQQGRCYQLIVQKKRYYPFYPMGRVAKGGVVIRQPMASTASALQAKCPRLSLDGQSRKQG